MLLVLSENSVNSDWVESEVSKAREVEKKLGSYGHVLCPITLDEAWKDCGWSCVLMNQVKKYNILDFSRWREPEFFNEQFRKLKDGLRLFYGSKKSVMFYVLEITDALGIHRVISEDPRDRYPSNGSVTIRLVGTFQGVEGAIACLDDGELGAGKRGGAG